MSSQFAIGTLVEYVGIRWRVQRVLSVEAVLLRSDAGEEVSADPLKLRLREVSAPDLPARHMVDELRYSEADWAEATRRRDLLAALASKTPRTTADVAAAATSLGVTRAGSGSCCGGHHRTVARSRRSCRRAGKRGQNA